jgi:arylsulfatase A-like enzyme
MDLTATVAAAGGASARAGKPFDGVDLVPALTGRSKLPPNRPLFFRRRNIKVHLDQNAVRQSAVRQGNWKYLRTYKPIGSDRYQVALYNLKDDIAEEIDLAASQPERVNALSNLLDQWEEEVGKTGLRFGDVPRVKRRK